MPAAVLLDAVERRELRGEDVLQQHAAEAPAALAVDLGLRQQCPARRHRLEQMERRELGIVDLAAAERAHSAASCDSGTFTVHSPVSNFCMRPRFCLVSASRCL